MYFYLIICLNFLLFSCDLKFIFLGTREDRRKAINSWVYAKCIDYKNRNKKINNQLLKKWALEAASVCLPPKNNPNNEFRASSWWMLNFKNLHGITGPSSDLQINVQPDPRYINGKTLLL